MLNKIFTIVIVLLAAGVNLSYQRYCEDHEECVLAERCQTAMMIKNQRNQLTAFIRRNICGIKLGYACCNVTEILETSTAISSAELDFSVFARTNTHLIDAEPSTEVHHKHSYLINNEFCGISPILEHPVQNKIVAEKDELPWAVMLEIKDTENAFESYCSGSLITNRYVLTAASCFKRHSKINFVRVGVNRISSETDCGGGKFQECADPHEYVGVESFKVHESYSRYTKVHDIALVRLSRQVELSKNQKNFRTVCLPLDYNKHIDHPDANGTLTVVGWGHIPGSRRFNEVLMKMNLEYLPHDACDAEYKQLMRLGKHPQINIQLVQLCAHLSETQYACYFGTGAPITGLVNYELRRSSKLKAVQHGIVPSGEVCTSAGNYPGIYTRVSSYMEWILDNIAP